VKISKLRLLSATLVAVMLVGVGTAILPSDSKIAYAGNPDNNSTQNLEDKFTESNQKRLSESTPAPQLDKSLERENLKKRLEFINDANRLGYVYLLSLDGKVIAQYTIKGKVSSLESYMTTTEQLRCRTSDGREACGTLSSPDLDGSYGKNPPGIFFFTTESVYVEWSGSYMYSSEKLNVQTQPTLTRIIE
jgi:hypothetical protein